MITVAAVAAVMGVFRLVSPWILAFLALVLFLAVVVSLVDSLFDRTRAGHISTEVNRPIARQEPVQSGEAERV
jgi:hypothetical protein